MTGGSFTGVMVIVTVAMLDSASAVTGAIGEGVGQRRLAAVVRVAERPVGFSVNDAAWAGPVDQHRRQRRDFRVRVVDEHAGREDVSVAPSLTP